MLACRIIADNGPYHGKWKTACLLNTSPAPSVVASDGYIGHFGIRTGVYPATIITRRIVADRHVFHRELSRPRFVDTPTMCGCYIVTNGRSLHGERGVATCLLHTSAAPSLVAGNGHIGHFGIRTGVYPPTIVTRRIIADRH